MAGTNPEAVDRPRIPSPEAQDEPKRKQMERGENMHKHIL